MWVWRRARGVVILVAGALMALGSFVRADEQRAARPGDRFVVSVTAYCLQGETASGEQTRRGIVAADPELLPLGSVVRLTGLPRRHRRYNGVYRVEDTGRAIQEREIDIFIPDCDVASRFGRQHARLRVLRVGESK